MNLQFKPASAERMEHCMLCGRVTDVPVNRPVTERSRRAGKLRRSITVHFWQITMRGE